MNDPKENVGRGNVAEGRREKIKTTEEFLFPSNFFSAGPGCRHVREGEREKGVKTDQ